MAVRAERNFRRFQLMRVPPGVRCELAGNRDRYATVLWPPGAVRASACTRPLKALEHRLSTKVLKCACLRPATSLTDRPGSLLLSLQAKQVSDMPRRGRAGAGRLLSSAPPVCIPSIPSRPPVQEQICFCQEREGIMDKCRICPVSAGKYREDAICAPAESECMLRHGH